MCNLYTQSRTVDEIRRIFAAQQMPLALPEGAPNLAPRDIAITDPGVIVRASAAPGEGYELLVRRWSWPGPGGKPLYNFRSDGREFPSGRCLVLADGFYEFTAPADPKAKRKDRWMFSDAGGGMLAIAGLVRDDPGRGEAYTLLTTTPGADVLPYHGRQVALVAPGDWARWLRHEVRATELLGPSPAGSLKVEPAPRAA